MSAKVGATLGIFVLPQDILPLGQQLWLQELETYQQFPSLQNPETYNLSQVTQQLKASGHHGRHAMIPKRQSRWRTPRAFKPAMRHLANGELS